MTEMMTCYETPNNYTSQYNTSPNLSSGSDDTPSPPKKQQHINTSPNPLTSTEDDFFSFPSTVEWPEPEFDDDLLYKYYGPNLDVAAFKEKQGENLWRPELWDPPCPRPQVLESNLSNDTDDDDDGTYRTYVKLCLKFLSETKGKEYVMVEKYPCAYPIWSKGVTHLNFYARLKDSEKEDFFYAEISHKVKNDVSLCTIVDPNICGPDDIIIHAEGVECSHCNVLGWMAFEICCDEDD